MKAFKDICHLIFFLLTMIHILISRCIPAGICSSKNDLQIFDRQLRSNQIQFSIFSCVLFFAQIFNFKPEKMFICQIHSAIEKIVLRLLQWLLGTLSSIFFTVPTFYWSGHRDLLDGRLRGQLVTTEGPRLTRILGLGKNRVT